MKFFTLAALLAVSTNVFAQDASPYPFPVELEADRAPLTQTAGRPVLIQGGRLMTITKGVIDSGDILILGGKIAAIGKNLRVPANAVVINAKGKIVTPGIVDGHIHRGSDATNEGSDSITGECRIEDVLNPNLKNVWQALAGGETTGMLLHGSANAVGGQSMVVKLKYRKTPNDMIVKDAPRMIKFALGENVTRSQSATSTRFPRTRMGVQALYRRAFTEAREYLAAWEAHRKSPATVKAPRRDIRLETLGDILQRKIWVQCHSYRADEMLMMVRLSQEFGFKLANLQHGLEAYKIAPEMAAAGVSASIFSDSWSFKLEGYDGIPYNAAISTRAGVNVSINTDGTSGMPSLILDAAKPMRFGGLSDQDCLKMVTINAAKSLGVDHRVGSLEVGKDGDIVIWDGHPLSVYSKPQLTMIEGEVFFERRDKFAVDGKTPARIELEPNQKRSPLQIPANQRAYVVRGATIYPVSTPAFVGDVRIEGEKIVAVGKVSSSGAHVINGRGLRVYPGFIDAGNSMGLAEISPVSESIDTTELGDGHADLIASTAMQIQSEHFPVARFGGVLVSIVRPQGGTISGQASAVLNQGWTTEDMRLGADYLMVNFAGGGGGGFGEKELCCLDTRTGFSDELDHEHDHLLGLGPVLEPVAIAQASSELQKMFDDAKAYADLKKAGKLEKADLKREAMVPYVLGQKPVLLRVRSRSSIRNAVEFGKKNGLKVILVGAAEAWKEAELLKKENVPVIIEPAGKSTLGANIPANDWDPYDTSFALPYLLEKAGVRFAFMSDDNSGSWKLPSRVGQSCAYGLSPESALRALTLGAAEILGIDAMVGSLQVGKQASFVIFDGDPFEFTSNIVGGFVKGRPLGLENRFTRLAKQWSQRIPNN